jgi:hypothetical protein
MATEIIRYRDYDIALYAPAALGGWWTIQIRAPNKESVPFPMPQAPSRSDAIAEGKALVDRELDGPQD